MPAPKRRIIRDKSRRKMKNTKNRDGRYAHAEIKVIDLYITKSNSRFVFSYRTRTEKAN